MTNNTSGARSQEPIHITSKQGSAVLISEDHWRSIQETLYLLSVPGMREAIVEGLKAPLEDCSEEVSSGRFLDHRNS